VLAGGHPRSRNELIANCMPVRGYMEARGRGFPRVRLAMRQFNATEPVLESDPRDRFVRVTLQRKPAKA
jgi:predicted HTH transcriptional regulator